MPLKVFNTLTRKKEIFKPIKGKNVNIYTCGPTVYSFQHIGNLRSYIFSDILKRVLLYNKYKVKQVINVTDVGHLTSDADMGEDKIEKAAKKEGKSAKQISDYYLKIFKTDFKKLNIIEPDIWPKASEHIKEQIKLIKSLEKKGYTYKTFDGIYFDTSKVKGYGKLAKLKIEDLEAGKRILMKEKKLKTDFALWKFSPKNQKRQQEWNSPWGIGFPGWHIECSAMSIKYLGKHFDIHTGGEDHIPIHHTNEIAQSEASTGQKFVNYWMHGAFLTSKGEKVSKSKGGLYTIEELEKEKFHPSSYRYLCLTTHYRKPLAFSLESLKSAQNAFESLKNKIPELKSNQTSKGSTKDYIKRFLEAINDDLNIPKALSLIWIVLKDNSLGNKEKYKLIIDFNEILGLDLKKKKEKTSKDISDLIKKRNTARKNKDFKLADKIRNDLSKKGIILEDTKDGTIWKKK
tara:strand:- start:4929 stop:6305 length:1377 start_codon:yes stop_codon:yes gene_type:complete